MRFFVQRCLNNKVTFIGAITYVLSSFGGVSTWRFFIWRCLNNKVPITGAITYCLHLFFVFKIMFLHLDHNHTTPQPRPTSWTCTRTVSKTFISATMLEKQSKFPRQNMKCRGKRDTTGTIPRSITFSPLHFMLYRGKSITFGTVQQCLNSLISFTFSQFWPECGDIYIRLVRIFSYLLSYDHLLKK